MNDFRGIRDKVRKLVKFSAGWMSGCAKMQALFLHTVWLCVSDISHDTDAKYGPRLKHMVCRVNEFFIEVEWS